MQYIDETRDILDTELTGLVGESYNRAYGVMVNIQLLSEMEEICRCLCSPQRKPQLKKIWWDRLLVRTCRYYTHTIIIQTVIRYVYHIMCIHAQYLDPFI